MNRLKKTAALVLTFTMATAMVPQSAEAVKKKVKLDKKTVTVTVGKTVKLKLKNNKKKVKWTAISGMKNVSLSKKGKAGVTIKGKKAGKAKVQAKIGKKKYVCKVTVKNKQKAKSVKKTPAAPGSNTGTAAGKPSPTASTEEPAKGPSDAKNLKEIIAKQRKAGATVSEDLQSDEYVWDGDYLTGIKWDGMELTGTLDFNCFDHLELVNCYDNQLSELDVTKCPSLKKLSCDRNQLSELDVTKCPSLENLGCEYNQLSKLDLTNCTKLTKLSCGANVTVIGYTGEIERS